jgi:hypothetical protein
MDIITLMTIVLPFLMFIMLTVMTNNVCKKAAKYGKKDTDMVFYISKEMPLKTVKICRIIYNITGIVFIVFVAVMVALKYIRTGGL